MRVDGRFRFEYASGDGEIFESGKKKLRIQKYPVTCGWGPCLCWILANTCESSENRQYWNGQHADLNLWC